MWYFAKTINPFVPFSCLPILWVESLLKCVVFTVSLSTLWYYLCWFQIGRPFSPPLLCLVVWSSERTCQVSHITLNLKRFLLTLWNSSVFIRWWHLAPITLMWWWDQSRDIPSFFHLPSPIFSSSSYISTFHLNSFHPQWGFLTFHPHLPSSPSTFHFHLPPPSTTFNFPAPCVKTHPVFMNGDPFKLPPSDSQ